MIGRSAEAKGPGLHPAAGPSGGPMLFEAGLLEHRRVADGLVEMDLALPVDVSPPAPGQFISVAVPRRGEAAAGSRMDDALLRRPFSVAGFSVAGGRSRMRLLYAPVGRVTARMRALQEGETLDCLGPLGTSFPLDLPEPVFLVAGGRGVAPMLFLAERLAQDGRACAFLYGGRCAQQMLPAGRIPGASIWLATDDGSLGHAGLVTELLDTVSIRPAALLACGPRAMLAAVARWAAAGGIPCLVSVETLFGCGTGLCGGCALPTAGAGGYLWACRDGPVLAAGRIDWEAWEASEC
ncbi:MAG: hypothetical protein V1774_04835 [Candidatus Eisenbacteria bacterium]